MACLPSRGLVSPCLPLSPITSPYIWACIGWCVHPVVAFHASPQMVHPLSRGLASSCLPLPPCEFVLDGCLSWSPHRCACVGWCVRLAKVCFPLSPIVSLHVCWVLDGVSAFPRSCLPCLRLCSIVSHMCACVRCCVRLPEVLVSHCFPTYVCLCWMVCPLVSTCFPLSPLVPHCLPYDGTRELALEGVFTFPRSRLPIVSPYYPIYVCLCWMV